MNRKFAAVISVIAATIIASISIFLITSDDDIDTSSAPTRYSDSEAVMNNINTGITVIDESCTYQTMVGFGCSSYQWSQLVGGYEKPEEIISLLFSDTNGIGLNIYRYNLGAGSFSDETIKNPYARTESFLADNGTFDPSRDINSQNCLYLIKSYAGDTLRVMLYANSPPIQLTKNGKAYSTVSDSTNRNYSSNISPENYKNYAQYLYSCCEFFINSGFNVTDISPINEPSYSHCAVADKNGAISIDKEGCFYTPDEVIDLYNEMYSVFNDTPVSESGIKILLPECGEADTEGSATAVYIDKLAAFGDNTNNTSVLSDSIAVHSYWSSKEKKLQFSGMMQKNYPNTGIYCTEYSQLANDGNSGILQYLAKEEDDKRGLSIEYALKMSEVIMTDLVSMNASLWCWSSACSVNNTTDALIYLDENDPENFEISKRLWCLGNFSLFINEGAIRLAASSGNDSLPMAAFKNTDGSFVCIYLNNTEFDITTDMSAYLTDSHSVYITDETHNLEKIQLTSDKMLTVPAASIVSVTF